jgi:mycothiol synthase
MTGFPYSIRNYSTSDFNDFVIIYYTAEQTEPLGRSIAPQAILERLSRPGHTPEQDLFLVETSGTVIGFMEVEAELGIGRVIIDCWVHPEHRRKGLGRKLLNSSFKRAGQLGAGFINISIREDNINGKNALEHLGFQYARRYLELKLDVTKINFSEIDSPPFGCRFLREGEEEILTQIQNRSFAGHWGYNPNDVATTLYYIGQSHRSKKDIVLACEEGEVTGYCWTEISGVGQGRIHMIGSDPEYRGKGIGKRLLQAGIANLKSRGVTEICLTVDSENEAACSLYDTIGFKLQTSYLWFEKKVDDSKS